VKALPVIADEGPPRGERARGPLEAALAALWPVAKARLYRYGHLRRSLALHRRFHLRFLRLGELKVAVPAGQAPDCESCVEICCTGPNALVSLRLRDIAALTDAGLERAIASERPAAEAKDHSWARREADGSVFHQVFPVLLRDATDTCSLLTEDRRCGAYPAWPLSCARYPYALDLQSKVVFWAKGCGSSTVLPASDAAPRVRALVRAVVDGYNERVKDAVLLALARAELGELGLLKHLRLERWP
jgi:Fe-S-cluster containining protein